MAIKSKVFPLIAIGMAMFSMFFGAGNIVFPLAVGTLATDQTLYALLGLLATAVLVPFAGVFAVMIYDGDYNHFFSRAGKWLGFLIISILMGLIGPFGAMPRCIALSCSTARMFFEGIEPLSFGLLCVLLIYVTAVRRSNVMNFVGWILSPFFLSAIALIVVLGIMDHPAVMEPSPFDVLDSFWYGVTSGYQTMDLLGSFFFSTVVIGSLRSISQSNGVLDKRHLIKNGLIASGIGAAILAVVYGGMSYVAALHSSELGGVSQEVLLGTIATRVLGAYGGITTCVAVILASLTTATALASVFAEFFATNICAKRISYHISLVLTLTVTFLISMLEFSGILLFLSPIVKVLYPAILLLCIVNIVHKLWGAQAASA